MDTSGYNGASFKKEKILAIPTSQIMMKPFLERLANVDEYKMRDMVEDLSVHFKVTDGEKRRIAFKRTARF
jgi:hypothetical protein